MHSAHIQVPWKRKYLAGWGYLLSRDVVQHIVNATLHWERSPDQAPGWYAGLHWEDVLVGLVASDYTGEEPQVSSTLNHFCTLDPFVRENAVSPYTERDRQNRLHREDVLVGLVALDYIREEPQVNVLWTEIYKIKECSCPLNGILQPDTRTLQSSTFQDLSSDVGRQGINHCEVVLLPVPAMC